MLFEEVYKRNCEEFTSCNLEELKNEAQAIIDGDYSKSSRLRDKIGKYRNRFYRTNTEIEVANEIINGNQWVIDTFIKDPKKQNVSEYTQKQMLSNKGYIIEKLPAQGKNCKRFNYDCNKIIWEDKKGKTSKSFDYIITKDGITEYILGKVTYGQGGAQDNVKAETVDFLLRAIKYCENHPNEKTKFSALIDGNSFTTKDWDKMLEITKNVSRVNVYSSDTYVW